MRMIAKKSMRIAIPHVLVNTEVSKFSSSDKVMSLTLIVVNPGHKINNFVYIVVGYMGSLASLSKMTDLGP